MFGVSQWTGTSARRIFDFRNGGDPEPGYAYVIFVVTRIVTGTGGLPEIGTREVSTGTPTGTAARAPFASRATDGTAHASRRSPAASVSRTRSRVRRRVSRHHRLMRAHTARRSTGVPTRRADYRLPARCCFSSGSPCWPAPARRSAPACCPCSRRCCPPARPAGGGGRSGSCSACGDVHGHDRRARRGRRRRRARDGVAAPLAVVVLAGFGVALLCPRVAARLEAPLARLSRFGPRTAGDGFASGLLVGAALGLRLRAVRGADPRRGHLGQRGARAVVAVGARLRARARRSCCSRSALGGRRVLDRLRAAGRGPGSSGRWAP